MCELISVLAAFVLVVYAVVCWSRVQGPAGEVVYLRQRHGLFPAPRAIQEDMSILRRYFHVHRTRRRSGGEHLHHAGGAFQVHGQHSAAHRVGCERRADPGVQLLLPDAGGRPHRVGEPQASQPTSSVIRTCAY